ncbi:hypothetical protein KW790_00460 [Candidatus Parcubacteria bacterium]|nr:hypothetical protein [Candidatus Parcubacteria bacterium]
MRIIKWFDRLEDQVRHHLSGYPQLYAFIAGVSVVLFWRGVWHLADDYDVGSLTSIIVSIILMLLTGTFVSFFLGTRLLVSGLRDEKRIDEKTRDEIRLEEDEVERLRHVIKEIKHDLEEIKSHLH